MKVLAFDCSGASCSAAVVADDAPLAQRFIAMERGHAEALLPMIETVLREAKLAPTAIDLIAVTTGPGSFTGLRIGLAAAHGLALANRIAAIGVTSFDAIVAPAADSPLIVALESKRAELFLQRRDRADPRLPALVPQAQWVEIVAAGPCRLAGDGAPRLAAGLGRSDVEVLLGHGRPDPVALARIGAARWRAGARTPAAPLYLRAPDTTNTAASRSLHTMISAALQPVREADLARLAELHAACFPDDAWNSSAIATVLAMPGADGRVFRAANGAPLGLLLDQCLGPEGEILTLGVVPAARRQGVARSLLDDLARRARAARVQRLLLEVAADNVAALALYRSFGFARLGIRRHYYRRAQGPAVDAWRFALELPPSGNG